VTRTAGQPAALTVPVVAQETRMKNITHLELLGSLEGRLLDLWVRSNLTPDEMEEMTEIIQIIKEEAH